MITILVDQLAGTRDASGLTDDLLGEVQAPARSGLLARSGKSGS